MVIVFGTGQKAAELIYYEDELKIEYFIDNDRNKIGKKWYGYNVREPEYIVGKEYDCVILSSKKYAHEMKTQLLKLGCSEKKIINAWELKIYEGKGDFIESQSPIMDLKIRSKKDYDLLSFDYRLAEMETVLANMVLKSERKRISYPGKCQVCQKNVSLVVDTQYSGDEVSVNFRERMVCPICHLNNRQRVMAKFVLDKIPKNSKIYLTEQVTPFYQVLSKNYNNLIGSEYLGFHMDSGIVSEKGIRHEDLLELSFADGEMDCIISNDVLEHVADIDKALKEIYRVLKREGLFLATFPINFGLLNTVKRAEMSKEGKMTYFTEPVYHGNPVGDEDRSLVFYDYGLDFMSFTKSAGFSDAFFLPFYSIPYGNIGVKSLYIFVARK